MTALTPEILERLKDALGPGGYLDDPTDTESYTVDARELDHGSTPIVLRPATTGEVAAVVR